MDEIFAAVDLTTAIAFVVATAIVAIGISLAFKGRDLGKRAIKGA